jgi:transcriptional regulator of met regulon
MNSQNGTAPAIGFEPEHGHKHHFRKVTITLPPEAYELLIAECARRKIAGEKNHLVSGVIREALSSYLAPSEPNSH